LQPIVSFDRGCHSTDRSDQGRAAFRLGTLPETGRHQAEAAHFSSYTAPEALSTNKSAHKQHMEEGITFDLTDIMRKISGGKQVVRPNWSTRDRRELLLHSRPRSLQTQTVLQVGARHGDV
jgi:hypothetical protein